jgi:hypothetical protein
MLWLIVPVVLASSIISHPSCPTMREGDFPTAVNALSLQAAIKFKSNWNELERKSADGKQSLCCKQSLCSNGHDLHRIGNPNPYLNCKAATFQRDGALDGAAKG